MLFKENIAVYFVGKVSSERITKCTLVLKEPIPVATRSKAVSYVSDHMRAAREKRANGLPVLRRRTQEASRERSTSVSVMSWKGKRGLLLS
jgi:hypothetical protein